MTAPGKNEQIDTILMDKNAIAREILEDFYSERPALRDRYRKFNQQLLIDILFHMEFLLEAFRVDSIALFDEYIKWCRTFYDQIKIPPQEMILTFEKIARAVLKRLQKNIRGDIAPYIKRVETLFLEKHSVPPTFIDPENPLKELAEKYFNTVVNGNRTEAVKLIMDAVENGLSIQSIYMNVFEPCQKEVGRQWQTGKLSVAQEHYFTAVTQLIISQLYPYIFSTPRIGKKMVAACAGGELHEIGIRMVADLFEIEGWDSLYIGANTPNSAILSTIESERPELVALSATLLPHVEIIREIIAEIRKNAGFDFTRILVGGYPFNVDQNLWKRVNADGNAKNARDAIEIAVKPFYRRSE